ncbi:MAG TPA: hypothetical protein VNA28_12990 [Solirubrobacteraceae bacterium]|nr:hypothetical protein [Solirubrobacteraceae bacterium]
MAEPTTTTTKTTPTGAAKKAATTRKTNATKRSTTAKKAATTRKTNATKRSTTAKKAAGTRAANRGAAARSTAARKTKATAGRATTEAKQEARGPVGRVVEIAETVVLVPVGAALIARDEMVSTLGDLKSRYGTRAKARRELRRFERRGSTALRGVELRTEPVAKNVEFVGARIENAVVGGRTAVTKASTSVQERIASLA